jgi:DinB family protein
MTSQQLSVRVAINSWKLVVESADKVFSNLSDSQLLKEVAPGRNRLIYLLGHLTAIQDAMFSILGLGPRLHPELDAIFVSEPDNKQVQIPAASDLKRYWDDVNRKLLSQFESLYADEWLQRHRAMSEEDYAKNPARNRLAVLLNRTTHTSYLLGQPLLAVE